MPRTWDELERELFSDAQRREIDREAKRLNRLVKDDPDLSRTLAEALAMEQSARTPAEAMRAAELLEFVAGTADDPISGEALWQLAIMRTRFKDDVAAEDLFRRAEKSKDVAVWAPAMFNHGVWLTGLGRMDEALELFAKVRRSGYREKAAKAAVNAGGILRSRGDEAGAAVAFEEAVRSEVPEQVARAQLGLGLALFDLEPEKAREALEAASRSSHPRIAPVASFVLAAWYGTRGEQEKFLDFLKGALRQGVLEAMPHPFVAELAEFASSGPDDELKTILRTSLGGTPHTRPTSAPRPNESLMGFVTANVDRVAQSVDLVPA